MSNAPQNSTGGRGIHQYEFCIRKLFPKQFLTRGERLSSVEIAAEKACRFLELNISAVFGFAGEISQTPDMKNWVGGIPTIYDSIFILNLLTNNTQINPHVKATIINLVENNWKPNTNLNFFLETYTGKIIPNDVDDISLALMGLLKTGRTTIDECRTVGLQLLHKGKYDNSGILDTFLPPDDNTNFPQISQKPRIDVGSLLNMMWFLGKVNLDQHARVEPILDLFQLALNEKLDPSAPNTGKYMRYYNNKLCNLFFFSRFLKTSKVGRERFYDQVAALLIEELRKEQVHATNIACLILSATNLKLGLSSAVVKDTEVRYLLRRHLGNLLAKQESNGSFPPWFVYQWLGLFSGSRELTTGLALEAMRQASKHAFFAE